MSSSHRLLRRQKIRTSSGNVRQGSCTCCPLPWKRWKAVRERTSFPPLDCRTPRQLVPNQAQHIRSKRTKQHLSELIRTWTLCCLGAIPTRPRVFAGQADFDLKLRFQGHVDRHVSWFGAPRLSTVQMPRVQHRRDGLSLVEAGGSSRGDTCHRGDMDGVVRVHGIWGGLPPVYRGNGGNTNMPLVDGATAPPIRTTRTRCVQVCSLFHCTRWPETGNVPLLKRGKINHSLVPRMECLVARSCEETRHSEGAVPRSRPRHSHRKMQHLLRIV